MQEVAVRGPADDDRSSRVDVAASGAGSSGNVARRSRLLPLFVLALIIVPVNLLHVARIPTISPLDELMHIDYLLRGAGPGFLRMSDRFSQEAMDEIACRGHPSQPLPACGDRPYVPEEYSWEGRNLASSHSPHYYVVTGVTARAMRAVLPGDSIVTWARALGSAWLLAGLALILASARRLGVNEWSTVPFLAVLALSPSTQHAATTVNPDATAVFAGGLVLLATLHALRSGGGRSILFTFLAALVAMLLDPGNLLAILAAIGFALWSGGPALAGRVRLFASLTAGVVVAELANRLLLRWLGIVDYSGNPQDVLFSIAGLHGPMVWGEGTLLAMLPPTKGYLFPELSGPAHLVVVAGATLLAAAALIAVALDRRRGPVPTLAAVGLATLVLGGPFLVVTRFVLASSYFPIPARYGLSVLPIVALAGGFAFRHRGAVAFVWLMAGALAASTVGALV